MLNKRDILQSVPLRDRVMNLPSQDQMIITFTSGNSQQITSVTINNQTSTILTTDRRKLCLALADHTDTQVHAHMVLRGHLSIVNNVRYNPSTCCLVSSGVEKNIRVRVLNSFHKCGLNIFMKFGHL